MIVVIGAGIAGLSRGARRSGDRRVGGGGTRLPTGVRRLPDWTAKRPTTCCSYARDELVESTYHAQGGVACAIFSDDDPQFAHRRHYGGRSWSVRPDSCGCAHR